MKFRNLITASLIVCLFLVVQGCNAYPTEDYSKVLILHLNFSNGEVNEQSVEMQYGHPPTLGFQTGDIHGVLKNSEGAVLQEFDLSDPRDQLSEEGTLTRYNTADFTLVMPYYHDQMIFDLTDKRTGALLKTVNFSDAIDRFRSTYPGDPMITNSTPQFPGEGLAGSLARSLATLETNPAILFLVNGPFLYLITGCLLVILLIGMILTMVQKK